MSIVSTRGVRPHGSRGRATAAALALVVAALAPSAKAFDFQDGRLEIHGFFEEQIRAMGEDFSWSDDMDLVQWYNVLSIETEYDFAPDGFGPFDILSGFARVEVRYDCVWTRACGMFPSADAFGNRVAHLPGYKTDGRRSGLSGSLSIADQANPNGLYDKAMRFTKLRYDPFLDPRTQSANNPLNCNLNTDPALRYRCRSIYRPENGRRPLRLDQVDGFTGLYAVAGSNRTFEANGDVSDPFFDGSFYTARNDDPAYFYFSNQSNCRFGSRRTPGGANGIGSQILGPLNMNCRIDASGALVNKPNPFNPGDLNPIVVDANTGDLRGGVGALPGRPASELLQGQPGSNATSQGVFYPSGSFRRFLKSGDSSIFDQNFSQAELAFNRGGSQQDEKEFKEGYLDMEFFDSRLWVRAGKQNIVWGKTELFRTTDQFNPVDLALASLPSLEEARIALWSARAVWSFYDVGPLEDLRVEIAANLDDYEPADIGRCGEPFTAMVACNKTTALWAHGIFGVALAGESRPDSWWEDASGLEYGARVEFRAGRFSFQVMDFYGYEDLPYVNRINSFERRADLQTGRPLKAKARGSCITGFESDCLPLTSNLSLGPADPKSADPLANSGALVPGLGDQATRRATLENLSANIQIFATICATSIGFASDTDPAACGQSVFNSQVQLPPTFPPIYAPSTARKGAGTVASLLSNTLAGNLAARTTVQNFFTTGAVVPYIRLNLDPCDRFLSTNDGNCSNILGRAPTTGFGGGAGPGGQFLQRTLNQVLTDEQESLLGCGPFWGTDCEADGVDLLNAEASVLMQSFPGIEGDYGNTVRDNGLLGYCIGCVDSNGNLMPVPGTLAFNGNNPGARWDGQKLVLLPGARGPGDANYNPLQDGCVGPGPFGCNVGDVVNGVARTIVPESLVIPVYNDPAAGVVNGFGAAAGLPFRSEMAGLSWNFLLTLVAFSRAPSETTPRQPAADQFDPANPTSRVPGQCSYVQPQYCSSVISFFSISGAQRNSVRAGGNGQFGRRDFQWHAGGEGVLEYQKRNVLGFSTDFAEDYTKSNWGIETTWISNVKFSDNDSLQGVNTADTFNLTVSVDRPTFINFLNPNRTFFFNSQIFLQYINNYKGGFVNNGPFNMLGTFTVQTGYMQDRLLPNVTFVYDVNSNSGAALPAITYRFTESFSATVGMNFFWGRWEYEDSAIAPLGTIGSESGSKAYQDGVENGLSVVVALGPRAPPLPPAPPGGGARRRPPPPPTPMRTRTYRPVSCLALLALLLAGRTAGAFDFFDGRLQIHGYGETTLRGMADDFHPENAVASQWMNVLNLEVEADIAPKGFGPFDLISGFGRVLVRYDCIYNGCGVVPTWRYYGDRANRQARNLTDGRTNPYSGTLRQPDPLPDAFGNVDRKDFPERDVHQGNELLSTIQLPFFDDLSRLGSDGLEATILPIRDARFAVKDIDASIGNGTFTLGPWRPDADIDAIGSLDVVQNTTLGLPLRPVVPPAGTQGGLSPRGLFVPSNSLIEHENDFDDFDQNYTQNELAWHHVGSQDERELKEAYIDAEMFDGRLWLRAGKQSIVWGKTELFRTTDQFNPQTLALSSLPSLEESRIALWSARATWSFYDVGPLEDVRFEVAANLDDFEPIDLGRCGVPYTVWLVCGKTFGLWGHGFAGAGIAGENRPDDWWNDVKGLEFGARVEFRWDRFSFQISDFWGYEDFFTIDNFNEYERKVDPFTGRPLDVNGNPLVPGQSAADVLRLHPGNRQLFDVACSATVGIAKGLFPALADRCLVDLVNSQEQIFLGFITPATALSAVLGGSTSGDTVMSILAPTAPPLQQLNRDPADGISGSPFGPRQGLGAFLTDQQEALLGCGPFYGTDCDVEGVDLFNAEASTLVQSFPQFERGGPVATRYVPGRGTVILPGARGPTDAGYSPLIDGCTGPGPVGCNAGDPGRTGPSASLLTNPLTGELFRNELAAASYNFMILLAGLSAGSGNDPACVPTDPFTCAFVQGLFGIAGSRRPEVRAGGNGSFGRRDFIWSGGSEIQLRYQKRNVLGFATDFAHDATGTNWSVEATWINGQPFGVASEERGWDRFDTYNLTLSVDRPTFIKFLNQSRTFFINSQIFLRYIDDYVDDDAMGVHGPFSALGTLTFITGYHQDRLLPAVTWVHDVASASGGLIGQVTYRFSQDFSATFGIAGYYGDPDELQVPVSAPLLGNQGGDYKADVRYDGLSAISERDEAFLTLRYTF